MQSVELFFRLLVIWFGCSLSRRLAFCNLAASTSAPLPRRVAALGVQSANCFGVSGSLRFRSAPAALRRSLFRREDLSPGRVGCPAKQCVGPPAGACGDIVHPEATALCLTAPHPARTAAEAVW